MTEEQRFFKGRFFASEVPELVEKKRKAHRLSQEFHNLFEDDADARAACERVFRTETGRRLLNSIYGTTP